jgi:TrmH family RNA methyltransferase
MSWYHSVMLARVRRITSRQNALVAEFRAIARGDHPGLLLDGPHLVAEALTARVAVRLAMIRADARDRHDVGALVARVEQSGGEVLSVSAPVMAAVSPVRSSSVIVAIADRPPSSGERLYVGTPLVVVACDVQDPGNIGAMVRVAEAAGGTGLIAAGRCADPFGPKALRGSMGSALRLPIEVADVDAAVADVRRHHCRVLAAVPRGGASIFDIDLTGPVAILIGSEGAGLPGSLLASADERFSIPMQPQVESLNAAVTAALAVYEARRQRHARRRTTTQQD